MNRCLRVAVVGVGRWGYNLAKSLSEIETCRLVAVCDSSLERLEQVASALHVPSSSEHFDDVLTNEVDAVVIATPPESHARLGRLAVDAGKHVFVEKPLATSLAEGLELEQAARAKQRVVMAGHLLRFHGGVVKMRELILSGELGQVEIVASRRLGWRAADRCGPWWSLAPHDLTVLRCCLGGEPQRVAAAAALGAPTSWNPVRALLGPAPSSQRPARSPIRVTAFCEFPGGIASLVDVGLLDNSKMRRVVAVGHHAMARFEDGDQGGVWVKPTPRRVHWPKLPEGDGEFTVDQAERILDTLDDIAAQGSPWTLIETGWQEPLNLEMRQFVAACEDPRLGRMEMDDALANLRALEAGARSMRDGGRSIRVQPRTKSLESVSDEAPSRPSQL
jgi:UDP-2-acetamido-3-amino-2,3-dideoxy-glucuronate N-acetyltransferase